ncbi:MAG TPA: O-antigen ligase family protein [Terriglobales bacterium]|nr:O-antigen ligase family protein [Terriglobales bacterium]
MSGQTQIMSAEVLAAARARSTTAAAATATLRYFVLYGLGAVLVYGVITFGAVDPWSLFGLQAMAAGLLALWAIQQLVAGADLVLSPLYAPVALFAAITGVQLVLHRTAYAYMTRTATLTYLAYAMILLVAVQMLRTQEDVKRLVGFLTVSGFLVAIFAVIQDLTSKGEIYWMVPVLGSSFIFGPYVNHNHYAGIMEMLAPFPLVLSMMEELTPPKRVLLAFAGVFMAGTIFLSLSRGGMTAFGFEMVFLAVVLWWKNASRRSAAIFAMACLLILMFLLWLGGKNLVERFVSFKTDDASYHARIQVARDSIPMIKARPLTGWGLGTFPTVYPRYRTFYTEVYFNAAHNDYVQVLAETGVLGFTAVLGFLAVVYVRGFRRLRAPGLDLTQAATLAALLGVTGILVHSFVDFNLQIPANAATFYVVAAIATASFPSTPPRRRRSGRTAA